MIKVVRKESAEIVQKTMKELLSVEGLIGEGEPYSTLQHCLLDMNRSINNSMSDVRNQNVGLLCQFDQSTKRIDRIKKEQCDLNKYYLELRKE